MSDDIDSMSFATELLSKGFDNETIIKLNDNGFKSVSDLTLLAEEENALKELNLKLAQRLLLKREVRKIVNVSAVSDNREPADQRNPIAACTGERTATKCCGHPGGQSGNVRQLSAVSVIR